MKKKILIVAVAVILIVLGVLTAVVLKQNSAEKSSAAVIEAGAGETIVYATIEEVTGNDIEVSLLEETAAQQMIELSQTAREASEENNSSARMSDGNFPNGGGMPDMIGGGFPSGGGFGGGMPGMSGGGSGGGMPDMSDIEGSEVVVMEVPESELNDISESSEIPDGGKRPENGMPEGGSMEKNNTPKEQQKVSYRIPVGTDVITTLGATTTFSHLEEGDTIAILMEQDSEVILKIWMIM